MRKFCFFLLLLAGISTTSSLVSAQTFPPPILKVPCDGECVSTDVLFKWKAVDGGDSYTLQILGWDDQTKVLFSPTTTQNQYRFRKNTLSESTPYYWRVKACNASGDSDWSPIHGFRTLPDAIDPFQMEKDTDYDGIPDILEQETLYTSIKMKTLFVRPKKRVSSGTEKASFEPWKEFIDLFPNSKDGKANIKAFQDADIEVVLIGEPSNPYGPMRNLWYDPADDPNEPPCTIMELVLERYYYANGDPVVYPNDAHEGHTYLLHGYQGSWPYGEQVHTWNWSIPAYTYSNPLEDEYNFPTFYPYPLERYISEGTYEQIVKGQYPDMTDCSDGGSKCKKASPMNLPDDSLTPPFNKSKDQTVEFNAITFDADGTIKEMDTSQRGIPNTFHKVLAKLVVHEMGHGLLGAMIEDHCDNPCCIMYDRTKNWEQLGFGRNNACSDVCTHSPGYSKDISHYGVVYNIQPPKKP